MEIPQRKITVIVASLLIVGSLVSIWMRLRPPPPLQLDWKPIIAIQTGLGERLAEETVKTVNDHGRIVLVTNFDHSRGRTDYCWAAFQKELKKHGAIRIVATEVVTYDPAKDGPVLGCPRPTFQTLLARHAQTDALVFFIALPRWAGESVIPPHLAARIIALDQQSMAGNAGHASMQKQYTGYFTSGILSALILPGIRTEPASPPPAQPKTPREWFDQHYQVYTPQSVESLPD